MELEFIDIEGHYGGDQHWLPTELMRRGGCSTVTAAEICAFLAAKDPLLRNLYPADHSAISKADFIDFCKRMFKFVYPRVGGLTKLSLYIDGFKAYAKSVGAPVEIETLSGDLPYEHAEEFLVKAIGEGSCLICLLLDHHDESLDDIIWHWFMLTGYEHHMGELNAIYGTYGKRGTVSLRHMWETGRRKKGGLIRIRRREG
ncbi:MAG: hypothetical protein ACOX8S_08815 [Christensenellales bacterium]|jgi:hypothetical protein